MLSFRYRTAAGIVDGTAESPEELDAFELAIPVEPPEVWGAGVTYERSRDARVAESDEAKDLYLLVYDAERPELFLKDAGCRRTVGPGEPIGVRADSSWIVPEPEIAVVLGESGTPAGLTIANDVSSRDDRGRESPLPPPGEDLRGLLRARARRARPRRLGGAVRDPDAHLRRRRHRALRRRDLDRAHAPHVPRARRVAAAREPRARRAASC